MIAATNKNLKKEISEGRFREDLYFRLNVVPVFSPPLRDKKEDIPLLVDYFCRLFAEENNFKVKTFSKDALEAMKAGAYDYVVKDNLTADVLERSLRYACRRHLLEQEKARMVEKLAELSVTDELTALPNRRLFRQRLEEEAMRSARSGQYHDDERI
mgnify:CR=1 FL=1